MPGWKVHRKIGRLYGFDEGLMHEVDRMLDFPEAFGARLKHKTVHNRVGIYEAYLKHGVKGAEYAMLHILLDECLKGKVGRAVELFMRIQERERPDHLVGASLRKRKLPECT